MALSILTKSNGKLGLYLPPLIIMGLLVVNLYMIMNHKSIVTTMVAMVSAALLVVLLFMSIKSIFKVER
ncbi:hypothetical protein [Lentibacillus salicampi]|uniref:Uncharacterized protein n=1 Tax=Lentibacillus salicampi TaxID=175306 RepID=A0A4Y9ABX4_9BACI|nr:hypothetical protein [Lentibacillus salicampi]TFJ91861.1 hypothetical protein E4U82_15540 [Lentibacillus salicampi]